MAKKHDQLGVTELRTVCCACRQGGCTGCVDQIRQLYSSVRFCACSKQEHRGHVSPVGTEPTVRIGGIQ